MMTSKWIGLPLVFLSASGFAAQPLFQISSVKKAPSALAHNASASAVYSVKNNTNRTRTLMMQPIQGITQITTTTGACKSPFTLAPGALCLLNLRINGEKLPPIVSAGPTVCNNSPNPSLCSQPSAQDTLFIRSLIDAPPGLNLWISVLIAQDEPPGDIDTYVSQIHALAPAADQIHLRVVPILNPTVGTSLPIYQFYADLIAALETAYATNPSFQVGFHPDNSKGSEPYWGCGSGDWQCVLNDSIIVMNHINALADPKKQGIGFTIFSIEQSYLEPVDSASLQAVKACLNPGVAAPGAVCPVATIASPVTKYGNVGPSYGDSTIYGTTMLDYGYPQYYNLVEPINQAHGEILITTAADSYFAPESAANCIAGAAYPYNVIDANLSGKPIPKDAPQPPLIPCFQPNVQPLVGYPNPANDVFTTDPAMNYAPFYDAYLMTQLPPISKTVDTNGSTVYITFSGEPQFLGAPGWTLEKINAFNLKLNENFSLLNQLIPGIVPAGVNTSTIKYAIWNFTAILQNNP